MNFFKKIFGRSTEEETEFDFEGVIQKYLDELPKCSGKIVISCKEYRISDYNCKIIVEAEKLLPWAINHAECVSSGDDYEQAARLALPEYLKAANFSDKKDTFLPFNMFKVLRDYTLDFIENYSAATYCYSCKSNIENIVMRKENERRDGDWRWWTDVWHCHAGHLIHQKDHELKYFMR